jgi:hypothetical protein
LRSRKCQLITESLVCCGDFLHGLSHHVRVVSLN